MGKGHVKLHHSLADTLSMMDDASAGRLMKAMLAYSMTGEAPDLEGSEALVFSVVKGQIDEDAAISEKRSNNRKQNGTNNNKTEQTTTKRNKREQNETNANTAPLPPSSPSPLSPPDGPSPCTPNSVTPVNPSPPIVPLPGGVTVDAAPMASARDHPTIDQVRAYCAERGGIVNPDRWYAYYVSNGWKVGKNPMRDWKAAVRTWERSGYDGGGRNGQARRSPTEDFGVGQPKRVGSEIIV